MTVCKNYKLTTVQPEHLAEMMSWFFSQQEVNDWAGPNFTFPFNIHSFKRDLQLNQLSSYSLVSHSGVFLGFGQYYERLGKCHLGRLVISPERRGQGVAKELITRLSLVGQKALEVNTTSLFVLLHNKAAVNAYKKQGFVETPYPEKISLANCIYMVKANNHVLA